MKCENNLEAVGKKATRQALLDLHFVIHLQCLLCAGANSPGAAAACGQGWFCHGPAAPAGPRGIFQAGLGAVVN